LHRLRRGRKSEDPTWLRQLVPGAVLANYGLDALRFVKAVGIGDAMQAR
jgi:acyl dehydratase